MEDAAAAKKCGLEGLPKSNQEYSNAFGLPLPHHRQLRKIPNSKF
jgi:hypothetical protein